MTDPYDLIQSTLDGAFSREGVYSYWLRKTKTRGEDPDEYIVYTIDGDAADFWSDNEVARRTANIAVRYYYRDALMEAPSGRAKIAGRKKAIAKVLESAGFDIPYGVRDVGDIDDTGYGAAIVECFWGRSRDE